MENFHSTASLATLIGDVVDSRGAPDRRQLHQAVLTALHRQPVPAYDAPRLTVGDEFQGVFASVGDAIAAAFEVRLALLPETDVRFGLGWGPISYLDDSKTIQDGPGWWSAREAIEWTAETQKRSGFRHVRHCFRSSGTGGPDAAALNAALMCRDHMIGSLDERSLTILRGLMNEQSKTEAAAEVGISASAVSQRASRDGLDVLVEVSRALRTI